MSERIATIDVEAFKLLPPDQPDNSRVGVNFVDAFIKPLNTTLSDGVKVACKRRGLKMTFTVCDRTGEALLRRLECGPDPRRILEAALQEAATAAGAKLTIAEDGFYLSLES